MLFNEIVWSIDIKTEKNISPFEIRNLLYKEGIKEGTFKRKINYEDLEEKLKSDHSKISWVSIRPYGSKLLIDIREKQLPPSLIKDDTKKDLVAKKDGIIIAKGEPSTINTIFPASKFLHATSGLSVS